MKNTKVLKIVSIATAAALLSASAGVYLNADETAEKTEPVVSKEKIASDLSSVIREGSETGKEETVYVVANANGSAKKVIVSEWLKNPGAEASVSDTSLLSDIVNVKGSETYSDLGNGEYLWNAQGNDIYYQGTTDKSIPVDVNITYYLDGKQISPEELAGKSGRVTIRFDYRNKQKTHVEIDGKSEELYVPFAMVSTMFFDNGIFRNVEITNGKLINDGDRSIIMGYGFPGMQDNLDVSKNDLDVPDYFEVSADVKGFKLDTTVTVATNSVFEKIDLSNVSTQKDLEEKLGELQDGMTQIVDGADQLFEGISTLYEKSGELKTGVKQLYDGTSKLDSGASQLSSGTSELSTGAAALNSGLGQLAENSGAIQDGAKQVFDSLLSAANSQLAQAGISAEQLTVDNYSQVLTGVVDSLSSDNIYSVASSAARAKVEEAVNQNRDYIRSQVTEAVKSQVTEKVLAASGTPMSAQDYMNAVSAGAVSDEVQIQINAAVSAQMETPEIQAAIDGTVTQKIQELIEQNMASDDVVSQINEAVAKASAGAETIRSLIGQLDSYRTFYDGVITYTNGVNQASAGSSQLLAGVEKVKSGAAELSGGAAELNTGAGTLNDGASALIDGVSQLKDGAEKLFDGTKEFNEKGISKIVDAYDGDVKKAINRVNATSKAASSYKSFGGISNGVSGEVKFIISTESIG